MALSSNGNFLVTAAHDFSFKLWTRTDEQVKGRRRKGENGKTEQKKMRVFFAIFLNFSFQVFLEEEREKELEQRINEDLLQEEHFDPTNKDSLQEGEEGDVERGGARTLESIKGGEKLLTVLQLCTEEDEKNTKYNLALSEWDASFDRLLKAGVVSEAQRDTMVGKPQPPSPNSLLNGESCEDALFGALVAIPSPNLEVCFVCVCVCVYWRLVLLILNIYFLLFFFFFF